MPKFYEHSQVVEILEQMEQGESLAFPTEYFLVTVERVHNGYTFTLPDSGEEREADTDLNAPTIGDMLNVVWAFNFAAHESMW